MGIQSRYHKALPGSFQVSILEDKCKKRGSKECSEWPGRQCWRASLLHKPEQGITAQSLGFSSLAAHKFEGLTSWLSKFGILWAGQWLGHNAHESLQASVGKYLGSSPVPTNSNCVERKIQSLPGNCQTISTGNLLQVTPCCTWRYTLAGQPQLAPWTALARTGCTPSLKQTPTAGAESSWFTVHHVSDACTIYCKTSSCASAWSAITHLLTVRTQKPTVNVKRIQMAQSAFNSARDRGETSTGKNKQCPATTSIFLKSFLPSK